MVAPAAAIGFGKLIGLCVELAPMIVKVSGQVAEAAKAAQGKRQQIDGVGFSESSGAAQDSALAQQSAQEAATTLAQTAQRFNQIAENSKSLPNNPTVEHATQALDGTKLSVDTLQQLPDDARRALETARDALAVVLGPASPIVNVLSAAAQSVKVTHENLVSTSRATVTVTAEVGAVAK